MSTDKYSGEEALRKKRTKRKPLSVLLTVLLIAALFVAALYVCTPFFQRHVGSGEDQSGQTAPEGMDEGPVLCYSVLDVGQGLSVFIDFGETEVLIDGGDMETGRSVPDKIAPYVDGNIEYVIATHSHADHVGGLQYIYERFDVDETIYGDLSDEYFFCCFRNAAEEDGGMFTEDSDRTIALGEAAELVIFDLTDGEENSNNNSVVTLVRFGETSFLCTGDLEQELEPKLIGLVGHPTVVVAGHHGSNTSNSLLARLDPKFAAVSCGRNNDFYHPHPSVLKDALDCTADVYGTFKSGDIVFESDGKKVKCLADTAQRLTMEDAGARAAY